uniref:VWFC domain-containing protein n=1 Tax=Stomoxys calcitrans TaxID=35570 RepID=A0A1I8PV98_STOCA
MASLRLVNILTLAIAAVVIILPTQLEAYYTQNTGCHHNGTWYADKSLVPTTEKCLNCQCTKKTLVCRLKVCPEMPMPPPRGCVVVQKKNTCCPYLSCARLDAFYKIPATRRIIAYLDHYERESIDRVVNDNMLQRRSDDTEVDLYVCVKNGTVYKSGSAMSSSNLCSYCYCIGGTEKCVKPKCMLPLEGCKPIFVDSTCCPVRYDCSTKQTGKSSQEVRYRKTSNKHYMRMSQRLQRNRGCTVGQQFYAEGQKMKSDKDKPCDICFCIRGQRKCAPKKCAPALRNCIPVVPKGQCCPSSYDCGSQRDYRRSQNSRQFNLFSMLFGKDEDQDPSAASEIDVQYPPDRHPEVVEHSVKTKPTSPLELTTEKSIFDTLREGLEFIDNNNNQMLQDNLDLVGVQPLPTPIPLGLVEKPSATTELNFLDLLLGPSEKNAEENSSEESQDQAKTTSTTEAGLSWVDLLLAPDEAEAAVSSTVSDKIDLLDASTVKDMTDFDGTISIDRVDAHNYTDVEENLGVLKAEDQEKDLITTTEGEASSEPMIGEDTTQTLPTTLTETTEGVKSTEPIHSEISSSTKVPAKTNTTQNHKEEHNSVSSTETATHISSTMQSEVTYKTEVSPHNDQPVVVAQENVTTMKPNKEPDFLTALLDGITGILANDNPVRNTTAVGNQTIHKIPAAVGQLPTPKPMPFFKPLPIDKTHNRINSKIANLTVKPPMISTKGLVNTTFRPLPPHLSKNPIIPISESLYTSTNAPVVVTTSSTSPPISSTTSSSTSSAAAHLTPLLSTTIKPLVIKTNPTILEAEPLDSSAGHTLPPSLPNLKIIPFLPTDAVKADHSKPPSYEFYHHAAGPTSRIDYDQYEDANIYPSITEKYPLYPDLEDGSKAEYIYKFNVEGPDSLVSSTAGKFDGNLGSPAFVKYDFVAAGRQPPKVGDSYQVTQHIIDITTSGDVLNTTKVIEITTPDPFKDVIRTELPPDLTSLIEDKLKNLIAHSNTSLPQSSNDEVQISFDMNMDDKPIPTMAHFHKDAIDRKDTVIDKPNKNKEDVDEVLSSQSTPEDSDQKAGNNGEKVKELAATETHADEVSSVTIPPFKSLPQAVVQHMDMETTATTFISTATTTTTTETTAPLSTSTANLLAKQPTMESAAISAPNKRPSFLKSNRNKTIASGAAVTGTSSNKFKQPQLKLTKNKVAGTHVQPNATTTDTKISPSSSSLSFGAASLSKTKANATRRVTSPKPTRHYKPTFRPKTAASTTTTSHPALRLANTTTKTIYTNKGTPAQRINGTNIESNGASKNTKRTGNRPKTSNQNKKATMNIPVNATATAISTSTSTTTTAATTWQPTTMRTSTIMYRTSSSPSPSTLPTPRPVSSTAHPFLMSPFDKLPFMDASFEVKRNFTTPSFVTPSQKFVVATGYEDSSGSAYSLSPSSSAETPSSMLSSHSYTSTSGNHVKLLGTSNLHPSGLPASPLLAEPPAQRSQPQTAIVQGHTAEVSTLPPRQTTQQQSALNHLIDPNGILKLAGCNIYGRMYRVGRIILELSSPCQECRCTEIGVKCAPLDC